MLNILEQEEKNIKKLEELNILNVDKDDPSQKEIKTVMLTPADPIANQILTECIIDRMALRRYFDWILPSLDQDYESLIKEASIHAIGKHSVKMKDVSLRTITKAMEGVAVVSDPVAALLPNKSKRKNKVVKD